MTSWMPTVMPETLEYCEAIGLEEELWETLLKRFPDLVDFFEAATEDETWSETYQSFMKRAVNWFGDQFFADRLSLVYAQRVARAIQPHFSVLSPFIPRDLEVRVEGASFRLNRLLLGASSEFFYDLLRRECHEREGAILELKGKAAVFESVKGFVETGDVADLWKKNKEQIEKVLIQAQAWEMADLALLAEETLKRYINATNCYQELKRAIDHSYPVLKQRAIDEINAVQLGMVLSSEKEDLLKVTFKDFFDPTVRHFEKIREYVTHVGLPKRLSEHPYFSELMHTTAHLVGVDLSASSLFSTRLYELLPTLEELDLSTCLWLNSECFEHIIAVCPDLKRLNVGSNTHLNAQFWGALQYLNELEALDISRCHQIDSAAFTLLSRSCKSLVELTMVECQKVDQEAMVNFVRTHPTIVRLNVDRCFFSDALLVEIALHLHSLRELDVSRCAGVSRFGLQKILKALHGLKRLVASHCDTVDEELQKLREQFPHVELVGS